MLLLLLLLEVESDLLPVNEAAVITWLKDPTSGWASTLVFVKSCFLSLLYWYSPSVILTLSADVHAYFCTYLQQSILDMDVNELLVDSSNEARSSVDELDDHGPHGAGADSDRRLSSQGRCGNDAAKPDDDNEREFIPPCHNVPSSSQVANDNVNADVSQSDVENVPITDDPDILLYVAVCATIAVMASALYKQVVCN